MRKVTLHWMFDKDLGYYVWMALDFDDKNTVFNTKKDKCFMALEWCEQHDLNVVEVDDHGTRR